MTDEKLKVAFSTKTRFWHFKFKRSLIVKSAIILKPNPDSELYFNVILK
jgi:hypothetical protein